ncbi:hypothetical protein [Micromonospora sp. NPDC049645]|uniref:hypothetical protein n=1 Tax=Micromonospora sp. NPDC049645 TaxID=3155508 RepID=UPI0034194B1D
MADPPKLLTLVQLAEVLGFTVSALKKWRGNYIRARRDGKPLTRACLVAPDNEAQVIEHGAPPRWSAETGIRWAEQTGRRVDGQPVRPSPPGPPPGVKRTRKA